MRAMMTFETNNGEDLYIAKLILERNGYEEVMTVDDTRLLCVKVYPGEKPESALRTAGIMYRLRSIRPVV